MSKNVKWFFEDSGIALQDNINKFAEKHNIVQISYAIDIDASLSYTCMVLYEEQKDVIT